LQQAVLWQLRPTNPADAVQAPRPPDIEMKPVEEERAGELILSAEGTDMFLPVLTALCTGMRRGEILAMRWSDLDLEHSRLTVNQSVSQTRKQGVFFKSPKKKKSRRTITLPGILLDALREQRILSKDTKDLFGPDYQDLDLVIAMPDGNVWAPDRFTDAYMAFARGHKAVGIRFHDLLHTHASELLRRGTPLKTVSARLGHSNAR
jgi:integrase